MSPILWNHEGVTGVSRVLRESIHDKNVAHMLSRYRVASGPVHAWGTAARPAVGGTDVLTSSRVVIPALMVARGRVPGLQILPLQVVFWMSCWAAAEIAGCSTPSPFSQSGKEIRISAELSPATS